MKKAALLAMIGSILLIVNSCLYFFMDFVPYSIVPMLFKLANLLSMISFGWLAFFFYKVYKNMH